jgi:hypothetical protein
MQEEERARAPDNCLFPETDGTFTQNGVPSHASNAVMNDVYSHNVEVLEWPENNPDMNPVANM